MKISLIKLTVLYIFVIIILQLFDVYNRIPNNNVALNASGNIVTLTGKIITEPEKSENKTSFIIKTELISNVATKGIVLVNVYAKTNIEYGNVVKVTGKFFIPKAPTVPGTFNYKKYLSRKKIYSILSVTNKENIKVLGKDPSYIWQLSYKLRKNILDSYDNNLSPEQSSVLSGITIGEKSGLTPYIQKIFVDAGVMHVLVVSGSNVAFIALIFFWIFRNILGIKKKVAFGLLIPVILFYAMITGANPPVVRATVMTLVVIITMLLYRNVDIYHSIFLSALIILIYNPATLFDAGFQMSFAATIGIIYFYSKFLSLLNKYKLPKAINWILSIFLVSLAAQVAVAPLLAYYFNKVSIIALVSNLIILPLIEIALISGFVLYLASLIGTPILFITAKLTNGFVSLIIFLVDYFANIPHSTIRVPTPTIYFIILFYIIIIGLPKIKYKIWKWIVVFSIIILSTFPLVKNLLRNKNILSITFLDVGLGNSIYCEFPNGSNMLIDGGGNWDSRYDIGESVLSPFLWNKGVMKIDTIILTNQHLNHYKGLISICKNFRIGRFLTEDLASKESEPLSSGEKQLLFEERGEYFELMKTIVDNKIPIETVTVNNSFEIGKSKIHMLYFDNSITLNINYNDFSALLCGDISKETQNLMAVKCGPANILLVPNHGKKILSRNLLLKISPEFAIISTDEPAQGVLAQLKQYKEFSTSESGTITINTDGETIKIEKNLIE